MTERSLVPNRRWTPEKKRTRPCGEAVDQVAAFVRLSYCVRFGRNCTSESMDSLEIFSPMQIGDFWVHCPHVNPCGIGIDKVERRRFFFVRERRLGGPNDRGFIAENYLVGNVLFK